MSAYADEFFISHVPRDIRTVVEVGARDLVDSLHMEQYFEKAEIYAFEPHPYMQETIRSNLRKSSGRIHVSPLALSDAERETTFYMYHANGNLFENPGASSLYVRIDNRTNQLAYPKRVKCSTLDAECQARNIQSIDLLTMDTQGSELNILKGGLRILPCVQYVLMETPRQSAVALLGGLESKHLGAPSYSEIMEFMKTHNFVEVCRKAENDIEWNILFKNQGQCS